MNGRDKRRRARKLRERLNPDSPKAVQTLEKDRGERHDGQIPSSESRKSDEDLGRPTNL